MQMCKKKLIVAITGASGAIYGIKLLEELKSLNIESHLIISKSSGLTIKSETDYKISDIIKLADHHHNIENIGASIASGSFKTLGMVVVPCSMKTMSEICTGVTSNLISRAADVVLKDRRKLILGVRETPFHLGHLKTMCSLTQMGAIIAPPLPSFYIKPKSIDDLIYHYIGRIFDLLDIENNLAVRWKGMSNL